MNLIMPWAGLGRSHGRSATRLHATVSADDDAMGRMAIPRIEKILSHGGRIECIFALHDQPPVALERLAEAVEGRCVRAGSRRLDHPDIFALKCLDSAA